VYILEDNLLVILAKKYSPFLCILYYTIKVTVGVLFAFFYSVLYLYYRYKYWTNGISFFCILWIQQINLHFFITYSNQCVAYTFLTYTLFSTMAYTLFNVIQFSLVQK